MIYCDGSRYVYQGKRDKYLRKIYYDTSKSHDKSVKSMLAMLINLFVVATNTQVLYKEQTCHEGLEDFVSLAVTYNAEYESLDWSERTQSFELNYAARPTQIQICPWFIDCKSSSHARYRRPCLTRLFRYQRQEIQAWKRGRKIKYRTVRRE